MVDKPRFLNLGAGKPHLFTTLDAFWWIAQRLRIMHANLRVTAARPGELTMLLYRTILGKFLPTHFG